MEVIPVLQLLMQPHLIEIHFGDLNVHQVGCHEGPEPRLTLDDQRIIVSANLDLFDVIPRDQIDVTEPRPLATPVAIEDRKREGFEL